MAPHSPRQRLPPIRPDLRRLPSGRQRRFPLRQFARGRAIAIEAKHSRSEDRRFPQQPGPKNPLSIPRKPQNKFIPG